MDMVQIKGFVIIEVLSLQLLGLFYWFKNQKYSLTLDMNPLFVCFYLRRHEATAVSDQGSYARPLLMLAWVTNVSTSPDLYIEFSTEY